MQIANVVRSTFEKDDFLTEDTACPEDSDQDVFVVGGAAHDAHRSALHQIHEVGCVTGLKKRVAFRADVLDEKMFAECDGFIARALEESRMFQIPHFIFRRCQAGCGAAR